MQRGPALIDRRHQQGIRAAGIAVALALLLASPLTGAAERCRATPDFRSLDELRSAIADGNETSAKRIRKVLSRARGLERCFDLNAVTDWNPDAEAIARAQDNRRKRAPTATILEQPLHGVPVLLKANIDTADAMPTHAGANALAGRRAGTDAPIATHLRNAGAILVGKANLSEWANFRGESSISGWSGLGGQVRNPHALDRNPCGSSSGSASAVAAGIVPVAIGTETNGSIVCPAGVNGVVGYKPTHGRASTAGIIPIAATFDTPGPFARSVREAARVGSVLINDGEDLEAALDGATLTGKTIAVWRDHFGAESDPRLVEVMDAAVEALRAGGATLIDPWAFTIADSVFDDSFAVMLHEFHTGVDAFLAREDRHTGPATLVDIIAFNRANAELTMPWFGQELLTQARDKSLSNAEHLQVIAGSRGALREALTAEQREHGFDAVIALTNAPAWPIDVIAGDNFTLASSSLGAITGRPAVSLPAGAIHGLPVGVSLIGELNKDAALLALAHALEARLPPAPRATFRATLETGDALAAQR
ncbi:MAG: amidase family protein [Pseudomonadota bacterium]